MNPRRLTPFIKNHFIGIVLLVVLPLLTCCDKSNKKSVNSGENKTEAKPNKIEAAIQKKEWDDTLALISRVKDGDGDAAYELVGYYSVEKQDAVTAYFWAVQAKKLHHPLATDDLIKSLEDGVWTVLPDNEKRQSIDPRYEKVLPDEK
ncbi:MAG: hypothetical protein ABIT37_18280 [Luteolibacter sp.]